MEHQRGGTRDEERVEGGVTSQPIRRKSMQEPATANWVKAMEVGREGEGRGTVLVP